MAVQISDLIAAAALGWTLIAFLLTKMYQDRELRIRDKQLSKILESHARLEKEMTQVDHKMHEMFDKEVDELSRKADSLREEMISRLRALQETGSKELVQKVAQRTREAAMEASEAFDKLKPTASPKTTEEHKD